VLDMTRKRPADCCADNGRRVIVAAARVGGSVQQPFPVDFLAENLASN